MTMLKSMGVSGGAIEEERTGITGILKERPEALKELPAR
jgi:hypothetical protein